MTWNQPWMLLLCVLVVPIWWRWFARGAHGAIRFSSVNWFRRRGGGLRVRLRVLLPLFRTLAVLLLAVCLARPQEPNQETRIFSEGIAIMMLVDRSSSMLAMDFSVNGEPVDRLTAVKKVFEEFVVGDGDELEGRPDDLVGMITFAGFADSKCPLTLDHGFLLEALKQTEIVSASEGREEDGTAIGDAIALGVERLEDMDRRRRLDPTRKIKSKIMILLTDGESNRGEIEPLKAAELAANRGIKVYTIGAGTTGRAYVRVKNRFGGESLQSMRVSIDEDTLRAIAETTGGRYRRATDTDSLREIYAEIDELERTETEEKRYFQYAEFATEWIRLGGVTIPPLLGVVLLLVVCEVVLMNTVLRKVP
jgi:Ca-activated chloride channel homolog